MCEDSLTVTGNLGCSANLVTTGSVNINGNLHVAGVISGIYNRVAGVHCGQVATVGVATLGLTCSGASSRSLLDFPTLAIPVLP